MYSPKKYESLIKHLHRLSVLGTAHSSRHFCNSVPKYSHANENDVQTIKDFVDKSKKLLVITGAGVSTESGIPDYKTEGVGFGRLYGQVKHQDFIYNESIRKKYWAKHLADWVNCFSSILPNKTHTILSEWEKKGNLHWLVTQNVDGLHYKAGSNNLTELHGSAHRVKCVDCQKVITRREFLEIIKRENHMQHLECAKVSQTEYLQLSQDQINRFKVPSCQKCGGVLKPDIVFSGDNVPRPTVEFVFDKVKESDSLLILGSSLEVHSGYRFVKAASKQKKPIGIVNIGPTKADKLANFKISTTCSEILDKI